MNKVSVVTTLMRVVLGIVFLVHGISKLQMGLGNVEAWFSSIGIPGFMAYGAAMLELAGGVLLIIGFGTRIVSLLFALMMVGAVVTVKWPAGLMGSDQMPGYELELGLFMIALYLSVSDAHAWSIDGVIAKKRAASIKS
ncbi:DoxX family protein [Paenibacillus aquistagni]|uniref:DoxX family protein n=1 Tax=Paenibacillus aquistagni TaxID=1852522 RepID=UPI00145A1E88|nr:DoxX family protein [Paenibacillus aquistagni]NMM52342.1 DoxX family protein [Paenibacillus aquistagni]